MSKAVSEGDLLWTPAEHRVRASNVSHYMQWLQKNGITTCSNHKQLWEWSVTEVEAFWASLWDYFEVISDAPYSKVVNKLAMEPDVRWFCGSKVNFAEHILRNERENKTALISLSEVRPLQKMSWTELAASVRILATRMRKLGIKPGDSVCCLMPNIPETAIAMLATISIGAVWSNAAPEFGVNTVLDRFKQIKPKWIFVCDGYQYGGRKIQKDHDTKEIVEALSSSLERVVFLPYLDTSSMPPVEALTWMDLLDGEDPGNGQFKYERVENDHPLWILFSSGTTGLPKGIVHSHIGALMELLKSSYFARDGGEDDIGFFYTTTGWMMFNVVISMLLTGGSTVLYDGNPAWPEPDVLWKMASDVRATGFGASPTYVQSMQKLGIVPNEKYDLDSIKTVSCTGSPVPPDVFQWFYENVKEDLCVASQSGGTEIVGAFVGTSPILPVFAGEMQSRSLGMDVDSFSEDGSSVRNEVGELVCKKPFPSMPLYFLNDPRNERYSQAYFEQIPGVWCHGDFLKINDRGGCFIYGRSDATLNRYGIRIGTSELYRVVESFAQVKDSLVVCIELQGGKFFMPMFLELEEGVALTDNLTSEISASLRKHCSPRHVPDEYFSIPEVPYTLTGKKVEIPIRKLLLGWSAEKAVSKDSLKNASAIDYFEEFARNISKHKVSGV